MYGLDSYQVYAVYQTNKTGIANDWSYVFEYKKPWLSLCEGIPVIDYTVHDAHLRPDECPASAIAYAKHLAGDIVYYTPELNRFHYISKIGD